VAGSNLQVYRLNPGCHIESTILALTARIRFVWGDQASLPADDVAKQIEDEDVIST